MPNFGYILFCFSLLFFPKVGVVDISVLFSAAVLPFICPVRLKIPKPFLLLLAGLAFLVWYQLFVQLANSVFEFEAAGRLLRAFLTVLLIGFFFGAKRTERSDEIVRALLAAIFVHCVMVLCAALMPSVNQFFSLISGNDRVKDFRASGLMAGFDIAGFMAIIGMALVSFDVCRLKAKLIEIFLAVIFLVSSYFMSRVSVVIVAGLFGFYILSFVRDRNVLLPFRLLGGLGALTALAFVSYEALVVFEVTMSLGVLDVSPEVAATVVERSAVQDPDSFLWEGMLFFPESFSNLVFGTGADALESDIGYVKEIFRYGLVGLSISVLLYFGFVKESFKFAVLDNSVKRHKSAILAILFLMLLLTIKNNYIFVRGVFPAFLIVVGSLRRIRFY